MIKCLFWKSLKQLFIILLISCFGLLGNFFVNAWTVKPVWAIDDSIYNSSYEVAWLPYWNYLTHYLSMNNNIFMVDDRSFIYWSDNWQPYFHFNFDNAEWHEWNPLQYYICDVISWLDYTPSNCQIYNVSDSVSDFYWSFLRTVTNSDYYYYDLYSYFQDIERAKAFTFCFSSQVNNKSLCWSVWRSQYEISYCWTISNDSCVNAGWKQVMTNSLWLWLINFNDIVWTFAPSSKSSSIISTWVHLSSDLTWSFIYTTCTYWDLLNYLEDKWLNKYLCYWWLDNFDLYNRSWHYTLIPWSWKTVSEIFNYITYPPDSNNLEKFNYWQGLYLQWNDEYWVNLSMWENMPAVLRFYFSFYNNYWWTKFDFNSVYEYCKIKNSSVDLTKDYNWQYFTNTCNSIQLQLSNEYWSSWQVPLWLNWDWVWNLSWTDVKDAISFIQWFFNKAKEYVNFAYNDIAWFLPTYLILFMLAIIFFNFLRK